VTTSVSSKGQIVLPAEIRRQDKIKTGEKFRIERIDVGSYRLIRERSGTQKGWVKHFLSCPVKGYFKPLESPSTDTLWPS
jgi:AbrB family looped-hinge helix DNA binding protein